MFCIECGLFMVALKKSSRKIKVICRVLEVAAPPVCVVISECFTLYLRNGWSVNILVIENCALYRRWNEVHFTDSVTIRTQGYRQSNVQIVLTIWSLVVSVVGRKKTCSKIRSMPNNLIMTKNWYERQQTFKLSIYLWKMLQKCNVEQLRKRERMVEFFNLYKCVQKLLSLTFVWAFLHLFHRYRNQQHNYFCILMGLFILPLLHTLKTKYKHQKIFLKHEKMVVYCALHANLNSIQFFFPQRSLDQNTGKQHKNHLNFTKKCEEKIL